MAPKNEFILSITALVSTAFPLGDKWIPSKEKPLPNAEKIVPPSKFNPVVLNSVNNEFALNTIIFSFVAAKLSNVVLNAMVAVSTSSCSSGVSTHSSPKGIAIPFVVVGSPSISWVPIKELAVKTIKSFSVVCLKLTKAGSIAVKSVNDSSEITTAFWPAVKLIVLLTISSSDKSPGDKSGSKAPALIAACACNKPVSYTHLTLPTIYSV